MRPSTPLPSTDQSDRRPGTWSRRVFLAGTGVAGLAAMTLGPGQARAAAATARTSFTPAQPWLDTNGHTIQAHGGQVVAATDDSGRRVWYWYGEDRSNGYHDSPGIHAYSSYDLYNWTDEGVALRTLKSQDEIDTDPYFHALYGDYTSAQRAAVWRDLSTWEGTDPSITPAVLERPKVIHNASTGTWVMWVHADGPTPTSSAQYAKARAGVAVSSSPFGPYRWIDSYRLDVAPAGEPNYQPDNPGMARDMNLFVDDDGVAYIIYSSEENYSLFISKLDADYTYLATPPDKAVKGVDFTRPYIGAHREAPALFKWDDTYYLITSGATGWDPNPASYATATDILGTWTDHGNPCVGTDASTTFHSQSTAVIPYDPAHGKFIFMADRWTPSDLANSPYIWLPVSFGEGGTMSLSWLDEWTLADNLPAQTLWSVDARLPKVIWLGADRSLPHAVKVTTDGHRRGMPVRWDDTAIDLPGPVRLQGTLKDGRTFTRDVLVLPHQTRYLVNAGGFVTKDWTTLMGTAGSERGLLNSVPDQALGADPATGATWGYTGRSKSHGSDDGDLYSTLRYATNHDALTYTFKGLAAGSYTAYAGYYDPWPWANREASVSVDGTVVDPHRLFPGEDVAAAYPATVGADGTLTVTVTPTRSPDIQISWLIIAQNTRRGN